MAALIALTAGGTGGHVFPAAALAEVLQGRGFRLAFVTDRRTGDQSGALGAAETVRVSGGGLAGGGVVAKLRGLASLAAGVLQARSILNTLKPVVVVGFGGYASAPAIAAALLSRCGTVLHEQNAVLGRANRLFAGRVDRVAIAVKPTQRLPNAARDRIVHVGMPVRPAIAAAAATPYPAIDLDGPIRLLISGGSQGARVLSEVVPAALARLDRQVCARLRIVQQCRPEDLDSVRRAYSEAGIEAELKSFFDDFADRLAACHLLIGRAGASTVADVTVVGRPAILVPLPSAIDDHQTANAAIVAEAGAGWLLQQPDFTADALAERLSALFAGPETLAQAAAASAGIGRADAAERLADVVCALAAANQNNQQKESQG